tara:strand:+ start:76 stop:282 length:207 start_codon:yes stop_codon:yes gene_type:complete
MRDSNSQRLLREFIREELALLLEEEQAEVDDKGAKKDSDEEEIEEISVSPRAVFDMVHLGVNVATLFK